MLRCKTVLIPLLITCFAGISIAKPDTKVQELQQLSVFHSQQWEKQRGPEFQRLISIPTGPWGEINNSEFVEIIGVTPDGRPILQGFDNHNAAITTRTNTLHPGGISGHDVTGSGSNWLAIWDGLVYANHLEFTGRVTMRNTGGSSLHGTHVAGTMIATGFDLNAKGMGPASLLDSYDSWNDDSEMSSAAANGIRVSNHSYGPRAGWNRESDQNNWYWLGDVNISETEDYAFGYYDSECRAWDQISYYAPYYTICRSAGNDRQDTGGTNAGHYVLVNGNWTWSTDYREPDGGSDQFDSINWGKVAKNIITCGAVSDVLNYTGPSSVSMSSFSNWGPADDGRIKPDIVANGVSLYSCSNESATSYASLNGTSMSAPNVTGTVNVLVELYHRTHNNDFPLSSTMKGILAHTADECGSHTGPDYSYGWGLLNAHRAADLIVSDSLLFVPIQEEILADGETDTYFFSASGSDTVRVTLCWTDPPATVLPAALNNRTAHIVNDLDVRLINTDTDSTYYPWKLDPENPSFAAITGDNLVDNVEQIFAPDLPAGNYQIEVSHKGSLTDGVQNYSLIETGLGWLGDPRIPPSDLSLDFEYSSGEALLTWRLPEPGEGFLHYNVYRNSEFLSIANDTTYSDTLTVFGEYSYTVSAQYENGESPYNPNVSVVFPEPLGPDYLGFEVSDIPESDIELSWELFRYDTLMVDDGSHESTIFFSSHFESGLMIAQRLTAEQEGTLTKISVMVKEDFSNPFGQIRYYLMAASGDTALPGDVLYESEIVVPEEIGWLTFDLSDLRHPVSEGEDFWLAFQWIDMNQTTLAIDNSSSFQHRAYCSLDGVSWESLDTFLTGFFRGNPMMHVEIGYEETTANTGFLEFNVLRDGEIIATQTENRLLETFPGDDTYIYTVQAIYGQGTVTSDPLEINGADVGIAELSTLPGKFSISNAYPNPFNPSTSVTIQMPNAAPLSVKVYNLLGKEVATLADNHFDAGSYRITFNAGNLASGIYFIHADVPGHNSLIQKIVLMK